MPCYSQGKCDTQYICLQNNHTFPWILFVLDWCGGIYSTLKYSRIVYIVIPATEYTAL